MSETRPRRMTLEEHATRDAKVAKTATIVILSWAGASEGDVEKTLAATADMMALAVRLGVGVPPSEEVPKIEAVLESRLN